MPWCRVTITWAPTAYTQNYKRQLAAHSHPLSQQFTRDAMADALARINAALPAGQAPAAQNQLGINNQADQLPNDPGNNYRLI
jgi:hypothetical protein